MFYTMLYTPVRSFYKDTVGKKTFCGEIMGVVGVDGASIYLSFNGKIMLMVQVSNLKLCCGGVDLWLVLHLRL